jgi:hypothetical protein
VLSPQVSPRGSPGSSAGAWARREKAVLAKAMQMYRVTEPNYWHKVAAHIPGRSAADCAAEGTTASAQSPPKKRREEKPDEDAADFHGLYQRQGPRRMKQVRDLLRCTNFTAADDVLGPQSPSAANDASPGGLQMDSARFRTGLTPSGDDDRSSVSSPYLPGLSSPGDLPDEAMADVRELPQRGAHLESFICSLKDKMQGAADQIVKRSETLLPAGDPDALRRLLAEGDGMDAIVGFGAAAGWKTYGVVQDDFSDGDEEEFEN